jgi:hypothetical protein
MKLNTVPARQGLLWARQGVRVFLKRPLAYTALFASFVFGAFVLALVPVIGPVVSLMLLPLVSQAFMLATRIVVDGGVPTPMVLVAPLRVDRSRVMSMLWLGAIYAVAALGALWLSGIVDGGALASLMEGVPEGPDAAEAMAAKLTAPGLLSGLALRLGLTGLLAIPFWHAPALVYWDGQRCAQALFSSTLACWRNRGAFMVYGAAWFALVMAFGMIANLVLAAVGNSQLFAVAGLPISLIITTVFYASLYFTFADSFSPGEAAP